MILKEIIWPETVGKADDDEGEKYSLEDCGGGYYTLSGTNDSEGFKTYSGIRIEGIR